MRRIISGLVVIIFLAVAQLAYAHPPSNIKITFDQKTKILTAVIVHNTSNSIKHYVYKVDIGLNGKEIKELTFLKQDNNKTQTAIYLVDNIKDGDVLSVEGYCNLSGSLTKEMKIQTVK